MPEAATLTIQLEDKSLGGPGDDGAPSAPPPPIVMPLLPPFPGGNVGAMPFGIGQLPADIAAMVRLPAYGLGGPRNPPPNSIAAGDDSDDDGSRLPIRFRQSPDYRYPSPPTGSPPGGGGGDIILPPGSGPGDGSDGSGGYIEAFFDRHHRVVEENWKRCLSYLSNIEQRTEAAGSAGQSKEQGDGMTNWQAFSKTFSATTSILATAVTLTTQLQTAFDNRRLAEATARSNFVRDGDLLQRQIDQNRAAQNFANSLAVAAAATGIFAGTLLSLTGAGASIGLPTIVAAIGLLTAAATVNEGYTRFGRAANDQQEDQDRRRALASRMSDLAQYNGQLANETARSELQRYRLSVIGAQYNGGALAGVVQAQSEYDRVIGAIRAIEERETAAQTRADTQRRTQEAMDLLNSRMANVDENTRQMARAILAASTQSPLDLLLDGIDLPGDPGTRPQSTRQPVALRPRRI